MTNYLERALSLADATWGLAHPKPDVGAVLVRDGQVVGEGSTEAGGRHGEVVALEAAGEARARRDALRDDGALRPPRHDAARAPRRSSRRASRASSSARATRIPRRPAGSSGCAQAGVEVELVDSFAARAQNEAWRTWVTRGRPFVTYKVAVTLDGRVDGPRHALGLRRGEPSARPRAAGRGRTPSRSAWARCARTIRGSTRATCRRRAASRAASRSAAGRSRRARGSSCAPVRSRRSSRRSAGEGVQSLLLEGGPTLAAAFLARRPRRQAARSSSRRPSPATGPRLLGDLRSPVRVDAPDRRPIGEDVLLEAYVHEP